MCAVLAPHATVMILQHAPRTEVQVAVVDWYGWHTNLHGVHVLATDPCMHTWYQEQD